MISNPKFPEPRFVIDESFKMNAHLLEVLYHKYYHTLDNGQYVEFEDILVNDAEAVTKKRQKHIEVILSLNHLH